jgi:glycerol-3-phosphate dehydrogenase
VPQIKQQEFLTMIQYDLVVIGGGINGCACAAEAALRGLSVLLCEKDDLASKTSSNSSKLIHGGLRYLEHFNFSLVKKSLDERQRLLTNAPHLVHPLPFILPHHPMGRSRLTLAAGLFIYDHLSTKNTLPKHQALNRIHDSRYFCALNDTINQGFLFYDCKTDDARLVIANALQAKAHGARILTNTSLTHATPHHHQWQLTLQTTRGETLSVQARAIINAAGPWVNDLAQTIHAPIQTEITLVQGSHLIIPKLYEGEHAYLLQDESKRIIFTIPFHDHTLIGTTETPFHGNPDNLRVEPTEVDYLCALVHRYFKKKIRKSDIVSTNCGIRTLLSSSGKSPTALSRDYAYQYSEQPSPVLSILSGKITTHRELAEHAIQALHPIFPNMLPSSSKNTPLPGAVFGQMTFEDYKSYVQTQYPWLDAATAARYTATYGTCAETILTHKSCIADLGIDFGNTLYQAEVDYLIQHEWATTAEDILMRRTKLGLTINPESKNRLCDYLVAQNL